MATKFRKKIKRKHRTYVGELVGKFVYFGYARETDDSGITVVSQRRDINAIENDRNADIKQVVVI